MCIQRVLSDLLGGLMPLDEVDAEFVERGRKAERYRRSKMPSGRRSWPCGYGLSRSRGYWRKRCQRRFRAKTREALQHGEDELFPRRPERYARMVW